MSISQLFDSNNYRLQADAVQCNDLRCHTHTFDNDIDHTEKICVRSSQNTDVFKVDTIAERVTMENLDVVNLNVSGTTTITQPEFAGFEISDSIFIKHSDVIDSGFLGNTQAVINRAIAALENGGRIYIGAGVYNCSTPILINKNITFVGLGHAQFECSVVGQSIIEITTNLVTLNIENVEFNLYALGNAAIIKTNGTYQISLINCDSCIFTGDNVDHKLLDLQNNAYIDKHTYSKCDFRFNNAGATIIYTDAIISDCTFSDCIFTLHATTILPFSAITGYIDNCKFSAGVLLLTSVGDNNIYISSSKLPAVRCYQGLGAFNSNVYITNSSVSGPDYGISGVGIPGCSFNLNIANSIVQGVANKDFNFGSVDAYLNCELLNDARIVNSGTPSYGNNNFVKWPLVNRSSASLPVTALIPNTVVLTNDLGFVRWNGSAWIQQTGSLQTLDVPTAKINDTIYIKYGAETGSGYIGDSHLVIQRAITALGANGGTIYIGAGNYYLTAPITLTFQDSTSKIKIIGAGFDETNISSNVAYAGNLVTLAGSLGVLYLQDLSIIAKSGGAITNVLYFNMTSFSMLFCTRVYIKQLGTDAATGNNACVHFVAANNTPYYARFHDCLFYAEAGQMGAVVFNVAPVVTLDWLFTGCQFDITQGTSGLYCWIGYGTNDEDTIYFNNCKFDGNKKFVVRSTAKYDFNNCIMPPLLVDTLSDTYATTINATGCVQSETNTVAPIYVLNATNNAILYMTSDGCNWQRRAGGQPNSEINLSTGTSRFANSKFIFANNVSDMPWSTSGTAWPNSSSNLTTIVEYPKTSRTLASLTGTAYLTGTVAMTSDYGFVRWTGSAWDQQTDTFSTVNLTSGKLESTSFGLYLGTVSSGAAPASGNIGIGIGVGDTFNISAGENVAIGYQTMGNGSGLRPRCVAVGYRAGYSDVGFSEGGGAQTGGYTISIGSEAGNSNQHEMSIALGREAGKSELGTASIAIGAYAGTINQGNNSIILNATGAILQNTTANSLVVAPVRNTTGGTSPLFYNTTTKEISYDTVTLGTVEASKVVTADANKTITGITQLTTSTAKISDIIYVTNGAPGGAGSFVGNTDAVILNAYNALPATGGTIVLGPGTYTMTVSGGVPDFTKNIRLIGSGRETTIITDSTSSAVSFMVFNTGSYFEMRDLSVIMTQPNWSRGLDITPATNGQFVIDGCYIESPATLPNPQYILGTGAITLERIYIANTHFKTLNATNGWGVWLVNIDTRNMRIENCDFEIAQTGRSLYIDGPATYTEQTVCHMDGCRFIGSSTLNLAADVQIFISQCVLPKISYINSGAVPGVVIINPRIVITGCTPAVATDYFIYHSFVAQASTLTTNLTIITDGSRLGTGINNNAVLGGNNTVNLVIRSTDNGSDLQFSATFLTNFNSSDILIELPTINRDKTTIEGLSDQINGMLALSNDYGWIRRVSGAWVQQLTKATTLDVTNLSIAGTPFHHIIGELYYDGAPYTINMATQNTWYPLDSTASPAAPVLTYYGGSHSDQPLVGRLRNISGSTVYFHVAFSLSGNGTSNHQYEIGLMKGGVFITGSAYAFDFSSTDRSTCAAHKVVSLANNEYVSICVRSTSHAADSLIFQNMNIVIMGSTGHDMVAFKSAPVIEEISSEYIIPSIPRSALSHR